MTDNDNNPLEDKLWRPYDEKHTLLGTYIPNCLLKAILSGKYKLVEIRILLFIARMSFGFQREETNYLSLEDIKDVTKIARTHLSKAVKDLIKRKVIMRGSQGGNKYKYAINLLPFGAKMKGYEMSNQGDIIGRKVNKISNEDDQFDSRKDKIRNSKGANNDISINKSKAYDNTKSGYKYNDTSLDKLSDIKSDSLVNACESLTEQIIKDGPTVENILSAMLWLDNVWPNDKEKFLFYNCYFAYLIYDDQTKINNAKNEKLFKDASKKFYELRNKKFCEVI